MPSSARAMFAPLLLSTSFVLAHVHTSAFAVASDGCFGGQVVNRPPKTDVRRFHTVDSAADSFPFLFSHDIGKGGVLPHFCFYVRSRQSGKHASVVEHLQDTSLLVEAKGIPSWGNEFG